jgi:hypothetical protein
MAGRAWPSFNKLCDECLLDFDDPLALCFVFH